MNPEEFAEVMEDHRAELRLHCYRMTGSLSDAEDLTQETLLAAWKSIDGYQGRSSLRTWLYRIATNRCLNALRAGHRKPPVPTPPFEPPPPTSLGDVTWLQPYPDHLLAGVPDQAPGPEARYQAREAVELAFITGLQRMPPRQTAVLVLRDVLGYSTSEVADMLATTAVAVKAALQRARSALGPPPATSPPSAQDQEVARRFADALVSDDIDGVIALMTDDAWLAMPPAPHEYQGRAAIAAFLRASATALRGREIALTPTSANCQPAFDWHIDGKLAGVIVLTIERARISRVTRFLI